MKDGDIVSVAISLRAKTKMKKYQVSTMGETMNGPCLAKKNTFTDYPIKLIICVADKIIFVKIKSVD